jgi:replicative DNA helicase
METSVENFIDQEASRLLWLKSLEQRDRKHYFRSGYKTQDQAIGAYERGTLNSVGGFTGVGKTAYLLSSGYRMAREHGTRVFYFNLEMNVPAMWNRLACIHDPTLKLMEFRDRDITPDRTRYLIDLSHELANFSPFFFENTDIKAVTKTAMAKIERGSDSVLIIDYFALLSMRGFSATERFSLQAECAKLLKHLANHLDVPIITAIQLNRPSSRKKTSDRV